MKIFITGASGTLGTELLRLLDPIKNDILGLTRNEHNLSKLRLSCNPVLGDIRDRKRMIEVTKGVDVIFHLAALKHVDLMEFHTDECIKTNLEGTRNILAAQKENFIDKVVFVSTDKAVFPINVYGMCKSLSEKLVMKNPMNAVCRYGNVFGSRGSIFERLPFLLKKDKTLNITHRDMTRFWITKRDAARFVLDTGLKGMKGVQIPPMKSANVLDMMEICASLHNITDYRIREIGMRAGEKVHESLSETLDSNNCERFTETELKGILSESVNSGQ